VDLNGFFKLQELLNEHVGLNWAYFVEKFSDLPTLDDDALVLAGQWIDDILKAMSNEIEELRNCTYWKHWCTEAQKGQRYKVKDVVAARNEVIDILHFWISLAQILGMSTLMIEQMYRDKLAKNIKRQVNGYSIEQKDLAWKLFKELPDDNPLSYGWPNAGSLEDLPEDIQVYYLEWAKNQMDNDSHGEDFCDCISMGHYLSPDDPSLEDKPQPQPDPNCVKCGVKRKVVTMSKIECMKRHLIRACYWYYVKADPMMLDQTFDHLLKDLERREKAVSLVDPTSPTQMIYGDCEAQYPEWVDRDVKPESMECCTE